MKEIFVERLCELLKIPVQQKTEKYYLVSCPWASKYHKKQSDIKASCSIFLDDNSMNAHCFVCGSHDLHSLLIENLFYGERKQAEELLNLFNEAFIYKNQNVKKVRDKYVSVEFCVSPNLYFYNSCLPLRKSSLAKKFLEDRLIDFEVAEEFGVRYSPVLSSLIFPICYGTFENMVKIHFRSVVEKKFGYYRNSGVVQPRKSAWFGHQRLDFAHSSAILVESATDQLYLTSLGYHNVLASCGSVNEDHTVWGLPDVLYIGFDADSAGETYYQRVLHKFIKQGKTCYKINWGLFGEYKDPFDIKDAGVVRKIIASARQVAPAIFRPQVWHDKFSKAAQRAVAR